MPTPPVLYRVEPIGSGFLAIMARPRVNDSARNEFAAFADAGIRRIVSLLEIHEEYVLGLEKEAEYCLGANIAFDSFPIPDSGVPSSPHALQELSKDTYLRCAGGESTAIHCHAGIGRSSLVAAAVLLHCGFDVDKAFAQIQKARGLDVPETPEQAQWLSDNSDIILAGGRN